jgi:hypothetical protein
MDNAEAPSLGELCQKYGIESTAKASNMIITVNRRFQAAFRLRSGRAASMVTFAPVQF